MSAPYGVEKYFSHAAIWEFAQKLHPAAKLTACTSVDSRLCKFVDSRNRVVVAPTTDFNTDVAVFFRSMLRARESRGTINYLCNGQASTGTIEVAHWGARGVGLLASADSIEDYQQQFVRLGIMHYKVEHHFGYGWDDAGWKLNDEPMTFTSRAEADAEITDFLKDAKEAFGADDYCAEDFRVGLVGRKGEFDDLALPSGYAVIGTMPCKDKPGYESTVRLCSLEEFNQGILSAWANRSWEELDGAREKSALAVSGDLPSEPVKAKNTKR